jgi:hypothetical protein
MSWAGLKYFETILDEGAKPPMEIHQSPRTVLVSPPKPAPRSEMDSLAAVAQLNSAASVNKAKGDKRRPISDSNSYTVAAAADSARAPQQQSQSQPSNGLMGNYPQPFKCKGDYCSFHVNPTDPSLKVDGSSHIVEKLFSKKELLQLRKDKMFAQMMEFGAAGPALAVISMKNILLAREERRGLADSAGPLASFDTYPASPRSKMTFKEQVALSMKTTLQGSDPLLKSEEDQQAVRPPPLPPPPPSP